MGISEVGIIYVSSEAREESTARMMFVISIRD